MRQRRCSCRYLVALGSLSPLAYRHNIEDEIGLAAGVIRHLKKIVTFKAAMFWRPIELQGRYDLGCPTWARQQPCIGAFPAAVFVSRALLMHADLHIGIRRKY